MESLLLGAPSGYQTIAGVSVQPRASFRPRAVRFGDADLPRCLLCPVSAPPSTYRTAAAASPGCRARTRYRSEPLHPDWPASVGESACSVRRQPVIRAFRQPANAGALEQPRLHRRHPGEIQELLRLAQVGAALRASPSSPPDTGPAFHWMPKLRWSTRSATTIRLAGAVVISTSPELRMCAASSPVCHHTIYGLSWSSLRNARSTPSLVRQHLVHVRRRHAVGDQGELQVAAHAFVQAALARIFRHVPEIRPARRGGELVAIPRQHQSW